MKHLDRLDEGALATLNGWVLKVQDDEANKAMVSEGSGRARGRVDRGGGWVDGWMDRWMGG